MKNRILLLFFAVISTSAYAQHSINIEGTEFNLSVDNNNMTAAIVDYEYRVDERKYPMYEWKRKLANVKNIRVLNIPATVAIDGYEYTVTYIGRAAFAGFRNIDQVIIPNTVQSIGDYAFFRSSVTSVEIPASVKSIGDRAFGHCTKLKKLTLPNATIKLGKDLYSESKYLVVDYAQLLTKDVAESTPKVPEGKQPNPTVPSSLASSDVDIDIPTVSGSNESTFAIIIANEYYQTESAVHYALNDGRTFKSYCQNVLGIPEENIHLRENATLNNIQAEIDWVGKVARVYEGQANIIVYYAGHGIPDEATGSSYLLPVDGVGNNVKTGYSLETLYATLGAMPAKAVTVFMDACFSGSLRGDGMLAAARGVAIYVEEEAPQGNMVVFSAAQGDETAYPYAEKGHGLFTYYLLKKLKETKGNVSYGELATYLKQQVSRRSIVVNSKSQTPVTSASVNMDGKWEKMKLR
ncbi:MAG: caspase family protein [Bacteroidaceae bacterium]|nr:caspase family protein [Bacteroidaceae bacterium]